MSMESFSVSARNKIVEAVLLTFAFRWVNWNISDFNEYLYLAAIICILISSVSSGGKEVWESDFEIYLELVQLQKES